MTKELDNLSSSSSSSSSRDKELEAMTISRRMEGLCQCFVVAPQLRIRNQINKDPKHNNPNQDKGNESQCVLYDFNIMIYDYSNTYAS